MAGLAQRLSPAHDPTAVIAIAGLALAALVGIVLALDVRFGIVLLLALCFAGVLAVDLQAGLALWVPLVFLEGVPAFNLAGKAAGILIVVAWLGELHNRREVVAAAAVRARRLLAIVAALLVWLSLSVAWADDVGLALGDLWHWYALAVMFVIVITTVTTPRALRLVLAGFVAGAVLSVLIGIADGSFTGGGSGAARLEGGAGDPNYLASAIVASGVIAVSLLALTRGALRYWLVAAALAILVTGLVSSGSRGGMLAAGAALVLAFAVFKRRRAYVAAAGAVAIGVAVLAFVNVPDTWERVTDFDDDNGRSSLWTVGQRMWEDAPLVGVGLNNFVVHSADYVREPGTLENVGIVVERPHVPHNTYLQALAETGVVGFALFLGFCGACLRSMWVAARRFHGAGLNSFETVAQAVVVATASVLAAAMFLSAGTDKRLWLLLALGPALLGLARARGDGAGGRMGVARSHSGGSGQHADDRPTPVASPYTA